MSTAKNYSPADIEGKWYDYWIQNGFFRSVPDQREPYTIVIPPPNVTGILHMGHMLNNTIQDVLVRRKRMQGFNACWVPGTDHASIATEKKVVDMLAEKGISKTSLTREKFLEYAWEWKEKYGGIILQQLRKLGASCDWDRTTFTMDPDYYEAVVNVFIDLYNKGHIYRGRRMVNWDPVGLTAVSDEEVDHKETNGKLYYIKYELVDEPGSFVTIATTRPETILADTALSVHPDDERFKHLIGRKCRIPLLEREIRIIADNYVQMDFGTGCLKVTPAHDINDYEIGKRHGLPIIDILTPNGTLSPAAQLYVGQDRFAVRKQIVKDLEAKGHLEKTEDIKHNVGYSERTQAVIEPRLSDQWFLRMEDISKPALKAVMEDIVQLVPPKFKSTYRNWMENIRDWCISRQLWWGHRIPAWYTPNGRFAVAKTADEAAQILNTGLPALDGFELAYDRGNITYEELQWERDRWVKPEDLTQDPDVMDTWFSSWIWPIEVFKGLTHPNNPEIAYYYPTADLVTAPEILFFWVARMIIAGYEYKGEKPFSNVYLTGIVRDELGRKMSKSLGNSPDLLELIRIYGADGVRMGILLPSPAGNDLMFDTPLKIEEGTPMESKYCEQGRNFCNKLWNAFRLVTNWTHEDRPENPIESLALDWMEARIQQASQEIEGLFQSFRISEALMATYKLAWDDFCSWFLEMMKPTYGQGISARAYARVQDLFEGILALCHPFLPFVTEELWQGIKPREEGQSLMVTVYPPVQPELAHSPKINDMDLVREAVTSLRAFRAEKSLSPKEILPLFVKTEQQDLFQAYLPLISKFASVSEMSFVAEGPAGAGAVRVRTHEFYLPLGDKVDLKAEIAKIQEEIKYNEGFKKSVEAKLSNERFVAGAPAEVVQRERQKLADAEAKLKLLKESLQRLS